MVTNQKLIGAREVAEISKISIHSLRDYRKRGLIVVAAKQGNKDLYDKADVLRRFAIIREKRKQGFSMSQISMVLMKEPINVINMHGPQEPAPGMSDREHLQGFLAELYRNAGPETKAYVDELCRKWNIRFQGERQ